MDHVEVTTTLDLATTRSVLVRTLEDRGFRVLWEEEWCGRATRALSPAVEFTVFAVREGLSVVQLRGNAAPWYYFGGFWLGRWSDRRADSIGDVLEESLTRQEAAARRA